jgi:dipicolinate synthase subunit A
VLLLKIAVIGGDKRSVLLCSLLWQDRHRVHSYGLERAELPAEIPKSGCLQSCLYGSDCVVLPVPAEKNGLINAPFAAQPLRTDELLSALWPGQLLIGGKLSREMCMVAAAQGQQVADIMQRRGFTVGNAALTAEGAIERLMESSPRSIWGSRILVTGWGRVAKLLALRLHALGAVVTVAARKDGDRAMAKALSMEAVDFIELEGLLPGFDFVVNTVPDLVLPEALLKRLRREAVLLELASAPGGFDTEAAEKLGLKLIAAPGLPGQCAPYAAAELIRDAIYGVIREREE